MITSGERKCALLLLSLRTADRRALLARLPATSVHGVEASLRDLEAMGVTREIAETLVADDTLVEGMAGLTPATSLQVDELQRLSRTLAPAWLARVVAASTGMDRDFCVAVLDESAAKDLRPELAHLAPLPQKLADAVRAEAMALVRGKEAA